jgi:hypothetical protein
VEAKFLTMNLCYTHRSKEWQGQSSESAGGDLHRPLAPHDYHSGAVFVALRLVVPVAVIHRVVYRLALIQKYINCQFSLIC